MMLEEKRFQCHRGFCANGVLENTLESLEAAVAKGYDMVEFDVRLTRDYVPVLYHDKDLKRLHQVPVEIRALTLHQLKVFAPNVTTLEGVFASRSLSQIFLNIELKTDSLADPALEMQVVRLVKKYKAEERTVLSSFNPFSLIRAKALFPDLSRALLVTQNEEEKNYWFLKEMSLLPLCGAQFLHLHQDMASEERVLDFLIQGYKIAVYTVNDQAQAEHFFSLGVQSIITDSIRNS